MNKKIVNVVAAIIQKDNKILIAQRLKGNFANLWEFPGGKVELNESKEEALKRELYEEMEIQIDVKDFITNVNYEYDDFYLNMDCFKCELKEEIKHLNDHKAIKWIDIDEIIDDTKWVPADISVIKSLKETRF